MNSVVKSPQSIQYSHRTLERADRAMRCAPFRLKMFVTMVNQSVALTTIAGQSGLQKQYSVKPLSELGAEGELLWLIQVGLLRREVDGQGLTDSFRVTPLGRQLVHKWQNIGEKGRYVPSLHDRFHNAVDRWLRLPI